MTRRRARARPRSPLHALAAILAAIVPACASPTPDVVPLQIRLGAGDPRCRPSTVRAARLSVLGDFAPEPTDTVELLTAAGVRDVSGLRPTMRALRVELDGDPSFRAIGWSVVEDVRESGVIAVLPPLVPCTLIDPDATAPDAAALVAHPDGTAWIVGGRGASRRVARIDARLDFADVRPDALFNRREAASATAFGRDVIIAGGAAESGDSAYDSYERLGSDVTPTDEGPGGRLSLPRRDHGATRTGGQVVLVGGRSGGDLDSLVARIDVIDPDERTASLGPALGAPRIAPTLLLSSEGAIFVAGGRTLAGEGIATIERIEAGLDRSRTLDTSVPVPDLVLGLSLDRLFHVAGEEVRVIDLHAEPPRVELLARRSEILEPRGVALPSGRVLLVGTNVAGRALAELWTAHLGTAQRLELTRDPRTLLALENGHVLEIDGAGATLRTLEEPAPWSSLPNDRLLFPSDLTSTFVTATLPSDLDGPRATRSGVRLGLGAMVLGTFSIGLEGSGARTIRLHDASGTTFDAIEIALDAEGNAFGPGCMLSAAVEPIVVTRVGARLELVRGPMRASCDGVDPDRLFHLEIELDRDARIDMLRVARRAS
ncbi:MAG: hypothetical protein J0L92_05475 [Deltaproteobacteria bacterium]|nr:hypothetical protein [Deltaproteobacteria bacterium]